MALDSVVHALRDFDAAVQAGTWDVAGTAHAAFVAAALDLAEELGADAALHPAMARIRARYRELVAIIAVEHERTGEKLAALVQTREAWLAYEQAGEFN
ncbi:hypothetical protein [Burkholderia ubonensis]|uniref:hypothetical protein n=1 Tax=Burkholderia ubonensis TaxID=101571 RepID=UPI00075E9551|nr:hypothetical protein [Burkholderia ubonensis]KWB79413.1 hypothetical protein WL42_12690 [Burkholderia ubonensis]